MIGLSLVMVSVLISRCGTNLQNQSFQLLFSFVISVSAPVATVIPFPSRKEITPSGVTEGSWALEGSEEFKRLLAAKVKTSLVQPLPKEEGTESWARDGVLEGVLERLVAKGE